MHFIWRVSASRVSAFFPLWQSSPSCAYPILPESILTMQCNLVRNSHSPSGKYARSQALACPHCISAPLTSRPSSLYLLGIFSSLPIRWCPRSSAWTSTSTPQVATRAQAQKYEHRRCRSELDLAGEALRWYELHASELGLHTLKIWAPIEAQFARSTTDAPPIDAPHDNHLQPPLHSCSCLCSFSASSINFQDAWLLRLF